MKNIVKPAKQKVRLPNTVVADRYVLTLTPDLEAFTFAGEETIHVKLGKPTKQVTLHAKELDIESVEFRAGRKDVFAGKISYDEKAETATFTFPKMLPKGKGSLTLTFRGVLNDKMRGFYRSRYQVDGHDRHMATTQFEATDARRAFPCFDEPAHKSVFEVSLVIPENTVAISNTVETAIAEHSAGYKVVQFAPTPKMSTYLLAFIVGEFEFIESKTKDGVAVRVFTTPGKKHQAQFALDTAVRCLELYNDYFAIPYPLPTMDLIAIPDFESAAMENWGAVTYRESALLVDPDNTSIANKQWVAIVIAHELAHQWFGNLVTMEWWTHLWLNEGFASYMEHYATDKLFPKWGIWNEFVSGRFRGAMELDALEYTHPIEVDVHHPSEISEIFDNISYAKGSTVIRMLAEYIGEDKFRDGLRHYMKKFRYGNASTEDLWDSFEKVSKKPVRKMMRNWTRKPGYPVVSVTEQGKGLRLAQQRYYSSSLSAKRSKDNTVWQIPFSYITDKNDKPVIDILDKKTKTIQLPMDTVWLKLNARETGFFRTDYPTIMLRALKEPVEQRKISTVDRVGVVRDAFALAESGQLSASEALELAKSYVNEPDYTVWLEVAAGLATVNQLIFGQPYHEQFREFVRNIFEGVSQRVGWEKKEGEPETDALLRSLALFGRGSYGGQEIIQRAHALFTGFRDNNEKVPADLRGVVYNLTAENGGKREWEFFAEKYKTEELHEEQERFGRALSRFRNADLLERTLEFAMSEHVRPQDAPFMLASVWVNPYGRQAGWNFIKQNWKTLLERYGGSGMIARLVAAGEVFTTEAEAKDYERFFKKNPVPSAARTVQQVLEKVRSNVAWLKRDSKALAKYMQSNV